MLVLSIVFAAVFANNFILVQFLGVCPFLGVSKKTDTALGMGMAVIFVMGLSSIITYLINDLVLVKLGVEYMRTIAFIVVIAGLVQIVELFVKKLSPSLYSALGVYLPLITTNCAVLGVALVNVSSMNNLFYAFINGVFSGVGFTLAIVLLSGIREKLARSTIARPFQGFPITLITASIMSMVFIGFSSVSF